jgi:Bacterial SH3 domain
MISVGRLCVSAGLAAALLAGSVDLASAAPARVNSNTNLRQGPGTSFTVVTTVPGGSIVEVSRCAGEWCTAHWRGRVGYMIATNLDLRPGPVAPPPVVYSDPLIYGPPYVYGPRIYIGPRYRYLRRW